MIREFLLTPGVDVIIGIAGFLVALLALVRLMWLEDKFQDYVDRQRRDGHFNGGRHK